MLEFSVVAPMLVLLLILVMDFGRIGYEAMTITSAARVGASFGAQSPNAAIDESGIRYAVLGDSGDLPAHSSQDPNLHVTSRRFCRCQGGSSEVNCASNGCSNAPEVYVEVQISRVFRTLIPYPLVPTQVNLSRSATVRVQ